MESGYGFCSCGNILNFKSSYKAMNTPMVIQQADGDPLWTTTKTGSGGGSH